MILFALDVFLGAQSIGGEGGEGSGRWGWMIGEDCVFVRCDCVSSCDESAIVGVSVCDTGMRPRWGGPRSVRSARWS